jgi:chitin synthase
MMMVGTVLGPGTIFLMLVGAFSVAFGISNNDAFVYNLIPIIGFMLVCFIMDGKIQLFVAQILSAIYGLIMMAVLVGILLQVKTGSR